MEASKPPVQSALTRILSGIEAGVIGGLAMLALLAAAAMWRRHAWWEGLNLLGSTFYGRRAFRSSPSLATIAGSAFELVITGAVGAVFGLIFGQMRSRQRLFLLGLLAGVGWYYLADAVLWDRINPLVPLYSPQPATLLHALFGACLGYMGRHLAGPMEAQAVEDALE